MRTNRSWSVLALPVAVAVFQVVGSAGAADNQPDRHPLDGLAVALLLAGPAALALRRRHPVAVAVATMTVTLAYVTLGYPYGPVFASLVVALGGAVIQGRRLAAWLTAGTGYLAYLASGPFVDDPPTFLHAAAVAAWLGVLLAVAEVVRVRAERAAEASHARAEEARRQASEERLRIARELHDVLAHHISLINVQAGVALHLMDQRPEQARTALAAIRGASGEALREVRSVLGMLRQVDETAPRDPAPNLARLDRLVSGAEAAGLEVRLEIEGSARPLPAGLDLAAYRIVQEALTNVARHAEATTATVRLGYTPEEITVEIDDDGRGLARVGAGAGGTGSGIAGMRERAAALGGRLEAGPRPAGGFRVRAWLPLGRAG